MNIQLAMLTLMAWCFSNRAAVATVLSMQPCIFSYSWVNSLQSLAWYVIINPEYDIQGTFPSIEGCKTSHTLGDIKRSCMEDIIHLLNHSWVACLYATIGINPLRAKFLRENINIYLHFMSFLHIDKTQIVEIPPWVRQWPAYSTKSISRLLMSWRR